MLQTLSHKYLPYTTAIYIYICVYVCIYTSKQKRIQLNAYLHNMKIIPIDLPVSTMIIDNTIIRYSRENAMELCIGSNGVGSLCKRVKSLPPMSSTRGPASYKVRGK